ncbi:MAG: ATP-binding protein [Pseudomonadota bacterium]
MPGKAETEDPVVHEEVITALPLPVIRVGKDERIANANALAETLFGSDVAGRHYATIIRQPALVAAVAHAFERRERQVARFVSTEVRRDFAWDVTVSPLRETGGVLLTFEDVSDRETVGTQRRDFVANVSHELRTPLTALLGFIETLQGAAKDDPAAQERFLGIMHREASRMNRLVHDLLSLNRVESQERIRPDTEVDLAALARAAVTTLSPLADDNGIALTTAGLDRCVLVSGDADQLSQVATNLIENAIKYSGDGSEVYVEVAGGLAQPPLVGPVAMLRVSDTGEGFDAIHIPRLTERFYRVDSHRSREMGGTGLGLAIVKHIVNRHRGRLKVESTPGKGATFQVFLPAL